MHATIKRISAWKEVRDIAQIVLGSIIMGLGYALFLIPHHLVPGGVSGIAIMVNYFFSLPVGILILILNIPVFVLGIRIMGSRYGIKSLVGMVLSSLLIDFFYEILKLPAATDNPLLASIYSGVCLGVGLGIIFRSKASTGGTDTIGQVISKWTGITVGMAIMAVDFVIISASGLSFHSWEAPLYGYIVLYISTWVIDRILEGWNHNKMVLINSTKGKQIEEFILFRLNRGGTALKSRSMYLKRDRELLMTVIHRKQIPELREFVKEIDPEAFVVISDTYAVLGRGFRSHLVS
ncbi:MAG: YitT family protein [Acidobacteriota bacterium]|jgi:uncharacterized membrane-anchored protein YitT (DUF2179 family)|nr:YitT family protein [Acidobacteriota bacterium]